MPFFRRRTSDPAAEHLRSSFLTCAARVDAAQRALLAAVPTPRHPGVPLDEAVAEFERLITEARDAMAAWRDEQTMHEWTNCDHALNDAYVQAQGVRSASEPLGFEALNARIGDVLHALDAFADAAAALRRM